MAVGGVMKNMFVFPIAQGLVEQPVHLPAGCRLTRQSNRQLVDAVKVSAVIIDVFPEPVDSPVPTGLTGANSSTNNTLPLVRQMASEDNLSMEEDVVANLKFCYSVVGGPTSMPMKIDGLIVDLAGDITVGVSSRPILLEVSPSEWHPQPLVLSPLVWRSGRNVVTVL